MDLSVIIPTLNAAATLPATLASIGDGPEIIIVDGGSRDCTSSVAVGARVLVAPRGRGCQLTAGIAAASRAWLLLLHADTRLGPTWQEVVATHMRMAPDKAAYFRFCLDSDDHRARRLERLVSWRCRVLALPYGDQGLLVHRDVLAQVGGIRPLPLMEDVDLVHRLGRRRLLPLSEDAITSSAKWERDGWINRSMRNLICLSLWYAGVPARRILRLYR